MHQIFWAQILALPPGSCMTLGELRGLISPSVKRGRGVISTHLKDFLQGLLEDDWSFLKSGWWKNDPEDNPVTSP